MPCDSIFYLPCVRHHCKLEGKHRMKRMKQEVGEKAGGGMNATSNDAKDKCQTHFTWDFFFIRFPTRKKISKTNKNFLLFRIRLDHVINDSKLESPLYFIFFIIILLAFYPFLVFLVYFNFFFLFFTAFFLSFSLTLSCVDIIRR